MSTGNYVTIFNILTTSKHKHNKIPLSMYSSTYIYLFIYLNGSQNSVVCQHSKYAMGWTTKDQGSMPGSSKSSSPKQPDWLLASGPGQPPTQWVSELFLRGKRHQTMKLTTHHPHSQPYLDLYHNPRHAFKACRNSITPYSHHTFTSKLECGNRAATYTQVSAKYH